jgi:hypothetical protein
MDTRCLDVDTPFLSPYSVLASIEPAISNVDVGASESRQSAVVTREVDVTRSQPATDDAYVHVAQRRDFMGRDHG